jgi:sulfatase maturation enzyme AslB (radical SAM superfamily)
MKTLSNLERLVILKKTFDGIEVFQLAVRMTKKWRLNQMNKLRVDNLEQLVQCTQLPTTQSAQIVSFVGSEWSPHAHPSK